MTKPKKEKENVNKVTRIILESGKNLTILFGGMFLENLWTWVSLSFSLSLRFFSICVFLTVSLGLFLRKEWLGYRTRKGKEECVVRRGKGRKSGIDMTKRSHRFLFHPCSYKIDKEVNSHIVHTNSNTYSKLVLLIFLKISITAISWYYESSCKHIYI